MNIGQHVNKSINSNLLNLEKGVHERPPLLAGVLGTEVFQLIKRPFVNLGLAFRSTKTKLHCKALLKHSFQREESWGYTSHHPEPHLLNQA